MFVVSAAVIELRSGAGFQGQLEITYVCVRFLASDPSDLEISVHNMFFCSSTRRETQQDKTDGINKQTNIKLMFIQFWFSSPGQLRDVLSGSCSLVVLRP